MNVAGATVRSDNVRLLATMLDGELAAKLERAVTNDNPIVALTPADRGRIVAALADDTPSGLVELHNLLVKQHTQQRQRQAREQKQRRTPERASSQTERP